MKTEIRIAHPVAVASIYTFNTLESILIKVVVYCCVFKGTYKLVHMKLQLRYNMHLSAQAVD